MDERENDQQDTNKTESEGRLLMEDAATVDVGILHRQTVTEALQSFEISDYPSIQVLHLYLRDSLQ
jgi:hypothetical protein